MSVEDERKSRLHIEIQRRAAELAANKPPPAPLPASPSAYEGKPNVNSRGTLEKLRGVTRQLSAQLAEARQQHIVRITTLATELVDAQNGHIQELEKQLELQETELKAQIEKLEKELTYYRTWEESREVAELVDEVKSLKEANVELTQRLNGMILNHPAVGLLEEGRNEELQHPEG